jgi:hypothetical protein
LEPGQPVLTKEAPPFIKRLSTVLLIAAELRNIVYLTG